MSREIDKSKEIYREKDVLGLDKPDHRDITIKQDPQTNTSDNKDKGNHHHIKNPWVALILNFFLVGLSHVYAGRFKKGLLLYVGLIILALSTIVS